MTEVVKPLVRLDKDQLFSTSSNTRTLETPQKPNRIRTCTWFNTRQTREAYFQRILKVYLCWASEEVYGIEICWGLLNVGSHIWLGRFPEMKIVTVWNSIWRKCCVFVTCALPFLFRTVLYGNVEDSMLVLLLVWFDWTDLNFYVMSWFGK